MALNGPTGLYLGLGTVSRHGVDDTPTAAGFCMTVGTSG